VWEKESKWWSETMLYVMEEEKYDRDLLNWILNEKKKYVETVDAWDRETANFLKSLIHNVSINTI
jgi:hypothetical protein